MPSDSIDTPRDDLVFLDTNILLYAHDERNPKKKELAVSLLKRVLGQNQGVLSTQVLNEFAANALSKLTHSDVRRALAYYERYQVVTHSVTMSIDVVTLAEEMQINFWDALLIAAARAATCPVLYSEDLNHGQLYGGVRVENPFRAIKTSDG